MWDIFVNMWNILEYICQKREMIIYMFKLFFKMFWRVFVYGKVHFVYGKVDFVYGKLHLCTENKKQNILQLFWQSIKKYYQNI